MEYQGQLYGLALFSSMFLVALFEGIAPRRQYVMSLGRRWFIHFVLGILNMAVVRFLFPLVPVLLAVYCQERGLGLFNTFADASAFGVIVCLILLDFSGWLQHWLLHNVPLLWRLHLIHHSDPDYDFTTGLRFHPMEACFTWIMDALVIVVLGTPPVAVLIYKVVQASFSSFGHGNIKLPISIDSLLRKGLVTPDLHRIHHSALESETNSNYGGITPLWDRLLGTYTDQPRGGHEEMTVGLHAFQCSEALRLRHIFLQPFKIFRN